MTSADGSLRVSCSTATVRTVGLFDFRPRDLYEYLFTPQEIDGLLFINPTIRGLPFRSDASQI